MIELWTYSRKDLNKVSSQWMSQFIAVFVSSVFMIVTTCTWLNEWQRLKLPTAAINSILVREGDATYCGGGYDAAPHPLQCASDASNKVFQPRRYVVQGDFLTLRPTVHYNRGHGGQFRFWPHSSFWASKKSSVRLGKDTQCITIGVMEDNFVFGNIPHFGHPKKVQLG